MLLPQRPVSGPLAARVSSLHTALVVASVSLARQSAATAAAAAAQPAAAEHCCNLACKFQVFTDYFQVELTQANLKYTKFFSWFHFPTPFLLVPHELKFLSQESLSDSGCQSWVWSLIMVLVLVVTSTVWSVTVWLPQLASVFQLCPQFLRKSVKLGSNLNV
jgi:hypothetical protein